MGLDMYAWATKDRDVANLMRDQIVLSDSERELVTTDYMYWRKNHHLHGFMTKLWEEKTEQTDADFNCEFMELTLQDLHRIQHQIENDLLTPTEGFFFGTHSYSQVQKEQDLEWVSKAIRDTQDGLIIFYHCWW